MLALPCLSVCPNITTRKPLNRFSWSRSFTKICGHIPVLVKIRQQWWAFYMKSCLRFYEHKCGVFVSTRRIPSQPCNYTGNLLWWHHHQPDRRQTPHPNRDQWSQNLNLLRNWRHSKSSTIEFRRMCQNCYSLRKFPSLLLLSSFFLIYSLRLRSDIL
jgi:hypothetical protein